MSDSWDEWASDDDDSVDSHPESISDGTWLPKQETFDQLVNAFETVVEDFLVAPSPSPDAGSVENEGFDWGDLDDFDDEDDEFDLGDDGGDVMNMFDNIQLAMADSDEDSSSGEPSLGDLKAQLCDKFDATHVWRHLGSRFGDDEEVCVAVIEQYMLLYENVKDGTLLKQMGKSGITISSGSQSFFWSQLEIIHLLKNVSAVPVRFAEFDPDKEPWVHSKSLIDEVSRALAAGYLSKDLQRQIMSLRQQLIRTRKAAIKHAETFLKCSGAKGISVYRNGLPKANQNKTIMPLVFASNLQRTEALAFIRKKLGERRREIETLNEYRKVNKRQVEFYFDKWTEIRKDIQIYKNTF